MSLHIPQTVLALWGSYLSSIKLPWLQPKPVAGSQCRRRLCHRRRALKIAVASCRCPRFCFLFHDGRRLTETILRTIWARSKRAAIVFFIWSLGSPPLAPPNSMLKPPNGVGFLSQDCFRLPRGSQAADFNIELGVEGGMINSTNNCQCLEGVFFSQTCFCQQ